MPSVTITTSAAVIIAANVNRTSYMISNNSSEKLYLGKDSSVVASGDADNDGVVLFPNQSIIEGGQAEASGGYKGDIYGIVGANTADVRYWERTR